MSADRAACRAELVTLLETVTALAAVHDGAPFSTSGLSPVAIVTSDGTGDFSEGATMLATPDEHYLLVDLLFLRDATAEAAIDALSATVRALIRANRAANGTWSSLELNGRS